MQISRKQLILAAAAGILAMALFLVWRGTRLNRWEIVNRPPQQRQIVCFGDSLVHGVGATSAEGGYPFQLGQMLGIQASAYGVPGETAAEGLERLAETPEIAECIAIVTLGGNDILRRIPWEETEKSLEAIFRALQSRGCMVVYTGVKGFGGGLSGRHRRLCRRAGVVLVPNILKGILGDPKLKADQIHPNNRGYAIVAERIATVVGPLIETRR